MSTTRFFLPPEALSGNRVYFPPDRSRQIARVLRMQPGQVVEVLDGQGQVYVVRLEQVRPRETWGRVVDVRPAGGEPPLQVVLFQALLKGERMDWVLQKGTEVGVTRFVPMITRYTVVRRRDKRERWTRILTEAAEQCGRAYIPRLEDVVGWEKALAAAFTSEVVLMAHGSQEVLPLRQVLAEMSQKAQDVALLVGPEGGFAPEEVAQAITRGVHLVSLGPRTLRAETAAVVFATLLLHHWGDVG